MKTGLNKMMEEGEARNKSTRLPKALVCIRACDVPGIGPCHIGMQIVEPNIIAQIFKSPYFVKLKEDK